MNDARGAAAQLSAQCPACHGQARALTFVAEQRYRLMRCRGCRSEFFRLEGGPAAEATTEISQYWEDYKFEVYADPRVQTEFEDRYSAMLSRAQQRAGSLESVLDVGCGIGNFLAFAEQRGLRAFGIDIESEAVEVARQRGYAATVSGELDALVPDRSLDAVSLWDVIEHLYDPDPVLRQSLAKLRSPGGVVLLETPDGRFWIRPLVLLLRRLTRGKLDVSDYMYYWEHKIYFSKAGMRAILARHGCRVVDVHRLPSPRQKMSKILGRDAGKSVPARLIASLWPLLEGASTRLGRGNKLMVVAVLDSRPDDLQPHPA